MGEEEGGFWLAIHCVVTLTYNYTVSVYVVA